MSLKTTSEDIYKSILYRAADIYNVDYADVERDLGQNFDPIVRFMSGAMASELEKIYQHLDGTDSRIQNRLAKVLLPEYYHLPQAAHALTKAVASGDSFVCDETTEFSVLSEDEDKNGIAFSPVFASRVLPAEVCFILSENEFIRTKDKGRIRRNSKDEKEEVQRIALGIRSSEPFENWQGATLYFNLKEQRTQLEDRELFLLAMANSIFSMNNSKISALKGLPQNEIILDDYLNGNEKEQSAIRARYEQNFVTFLESDFQNMIESESKDFVIKWFENSNQEEETIQKIIETNKADLDKNIYWVEIHLPSPVEIRNFSSRISIELNVFPVVNKRLNGHSKSEHHFLKNNSIKWISLNPKEDFVGIRKVYQEKPPEYPEFLFKPFAEFREDRKPSYTLRYGGVGRWDDFNAWQRLAYLVGILQENYKQEELIEEAASSLSLEELHHLLGKKVSKSAKEEKPTKDIYVLLHSGVASSVRVRVEYWTSIGEKANNLSAKTRLECKSKHKSNFEKETIEFINSSSDGRAPLNSSQQLDAMKFALQSRGKIVTREDVKGFCRTFLNDKLHAINVADGVGIDPRFNFGMTRILKVELTPAENAIDEDWDGICAQIRTLIEQKSTGSIPIMVELKQNRN